MESPQLSTIGLDDSFVQLGGDSVAAMKVVSASRNVGLDLAVADIFRDSTLHGVAGRARPVVKKLEHLEHIAPFSMLGPDCKVGSLLGFLSTQYHLDENRIPSFVELAAPFF